MSADLFEPGLGDGAAFVAKRLPPGVPLLARLSIFNRQVARAKSPRAVVRTACDRLEKKKHRLSPSGRRFKHERPRNNIVLCFAYHPIISRQCSCCPQVLLYAVVAGFHLTSDRAALGSERASPPRPLIGPHPKAVRRALVTSRAGGSVEGHLRAPRRAT